MPRYLLGAGLAGLGLLSAACGKKPGPSEPVSGTLTVSYVGPSQTDGALLLTISGKVTSVSASGGYQVASAPAGATATRVVVTGDLVAGDILKLSVPDISVSGYTAHVDAAADRSTFALNDVTAYSATIRK